MSLKLTHYCHQLYSTANILSTIIKYVTKSVRFEIGRETYLRHVRKTVYSNAGREGHDMMMMSTKWIENAQRA